MECGIYLNHQNYQPHYSVKEDGRDNYVCMRPERFFVTTNKLNVNRGTNQCYDNKLLVSHNKMFLKPILMQNLYQTIAFST